MKAYKDGIIKEEDFSTEYNLVGKKASNLEQEKINMLNLNGSEFNPQHLMAERDIEREILTEGEACKTHNKIGKIVRKAIKEAGEIMPEDLPTPEKSLKQL